MQGPSWLRVFGEVSTPVTSDLQWHFVVTKYVLGSQGRQFSILHGYISAAESRDVKIF